MGSRARIATISILLAGTWLAPAVSLAHHSAFGRFDPNTLVYLNGTVTRVEWVNPHIYMTLETTNEQGQVEEWILEGGSPGMLSRAGINEGVINLTDRIRVAGWAPVTWRRETFLSNVLTSSGEELLLMGTAKPLWNSSIGVTGNLEWMFQTEGDGSHPELGIFRVWSFTFYSILFPESFTPDFDLSVYNLTDAAQATLANYNKMTDIPTQGCQPKGMPLIMEQPYPMEVVDNGDEILLLIEEYDLVRTIRMDPGAANAEREGSLLGYSFGRWEDETLVVTTTDINWGWFNQEGLPLSEQAVVVERFHVAEDGSRLDYTVTVTDPVNFREPVQLERYWLYIPGMEIEPYDCTVVH